MPKAETGSNTFSFELRFEELPLFREGIWRGGLIDGVAEISFDYTDSDWWVSDITVETHNGRVGDEAEGKTFSITSNGTTEALHMLMVDSLTEYYGFQIEEKVETELAERGYSRRQAA